VKVKVCGLTELANALACAEAGADWIGLNFHPASPRSISIDRGAEIAFELGRKTKAGAVGLFVDRPWPEVAEIATECGLGLIQLHGDEPPEYLLNLKTYKPPLAAIRAFRLSDTKSVDRMLAYLDRTEQLGCPPYAILVDAHVPGQPGGTGHSISFDLLSQLPNHPRLILAGGLTPENVAERVARVHPWMVDVASGVESSPGLKDLAKVAAFVAAAKRGISADDASRGDP
jgi:phosphoribosylanthranilate isomerase